MTVTELKKKLDEIYKNIEENGIQDDPENRMTDEACQVVADCIFNACKTIFMDTVITGLINERDKYME
jgi:hypothetical protein